MAEIDNEEKTLLEKTAGMSIQAGQEKDQEKVQEKGSEMGTEKQVPATPAPAITINSPSSPSPSPSPSPSASPSSSRSPSPPPKQSLPLKTPAPASFAKTPSAPAAKSIPKDLPLQTPISSSTPQSANQAINNKIDLSEFDPFATPAKRDPVEMQNPVPGPAPGPGPSTPRSGERQEREEVVEQEPTFNFSGFLKDLRMKSAEPIAKYLKRYVSPLLKAEAESKKCADDSFLTNFAKKPFTVNEQIKLIHDFLAVRRLPGPLMGCEVGNKKLMT
jgi:hypothetical protein